MRREKWRISRKVRGRCNEIIPEDLKEIQMSNAGKKYDGCEKIVKVI